MKRKLKEKTVTMNHWKRIVLPVAISSNQDLPIVNCFSKYNKFGPAPNCIIRDNHLKGTSHRKRFCNLL